MVEFPDTIELQAVLDVARRMCAAARTAPKARGYDNLQTCIVYGEDLEKIAAELERLGPDLGYEFFVRDARNIRDSKAVVFFGCKNTRYGMGEGCAMCHHADCTQNQQANGVCLFGPIDLGIAMGSAVSIATDNRVDNRIMYSAGKAAISLGLLEGAAVAFGIPLSVSGKSPFFDRK